MAVVGVVFLGAAACTGRVVRVARRVRMIAVWWELGCGILSMVWLAQ